MGFVPTFKEGDEVIMFNCAEVKLDKYKNKVFTCKGDSFISNSGDEVVFLKDYSAYFGVNFLKLVEKELSYSLTFKESELQLILVMLSEGQITLEEKNPSESKKIIMGEKLIEDVRKACWELHYSKKSI